MIVPVFGQSGYEVLSRGIVLSLDKLGINVQLKPKTQWNRERCFLSDEDNNRLWRMINNKISSNCIHILQQYPDNSYFSSLYDINSKSFCFSLFETNKCPNPWISNLNKLTKTWVFSEFNKKTYMDSGVKNVEIIPFGIDTKLFNPSIEPFRFGRSDEFVFLTNGDFTERKFFEGLVEAYVKEFSNKDKVILVIKTHSNGFIKRFKDECIRRLKEIVNRFNSINPPKILFLGDKLPWYSIPKFYTAGDCFILVSRGEGLGLPYAEALACEIPVIATGWGGHVQFLNSKNSLFVNYSLDVIDDMEYIRKCLWALNHSWATPSVMDIRNKMRFAYEFRDIMKEKGKVGRSDIEKLTWQNSAISIIEKCL